MAETLSTLSIISFAVSAVCLVFAVFFWFFFKIPTVIGDLSGRNARKSIAKMRAANEKTGAKSYRESKINVARGKVTSAIPETDKLSKNNVVLNEQKQETNLLTENLAASYASEATGMLATEETALLGGVNETVPLNEQAQNQVNRIGGKQLIMIDEVMLIHTEEVIG